MENENWGHWCPCLYFFDYMHGSILHVELYHSKRLAEKEYRKFKKSVEEDVMLSPIMTLETLDSIDIRRDAHITYHSI